MVACVRLSFLFMAEYVPLRGWTPFCLSSFIDGHLSCFYLLVLVNNAAMNIQIQVSV